MASDKIQGTEREHSGVYKAIEGWTITAMMTMNLGIYSSGQRGPINDVQETCDTITSVLWKERCHD